MLLILQGWSPRGRFHSESQTSRPSWSQYQLQRDWKEISFSHLSQLSHYQR